GWLAVLVDRRNGVARRWCDDVSARAVEEWIGGDEQADRMSNCVVGSGGSRLPHLSAKLLSDRNSSEWEPSMGEVTTIGLDLAKDVFQVHEVEVEGSRGVREW